MWDVGEISRLVYILARAGNAVALSSRVCEGPAPNSTYHKYVTERDTTFRVLRSYVCSMHYYYTFGYMPHLGHAPKYYAG